MRAYAHRCNVGHKHSTARSAGACWYCRRRRLGPWMGGDYFPDRRDRYELPEKVNPLVRRLFASALKQRLTYKAWAKRSGVAWQTIRKWRTRSNPRLDSFEACANALGFKVMLRPLKDEEDDQ